MNIRDFSLEDVKLEGLGGSYFSQGFQRSFPILPPMTSGPGKSYVCKLDPMKKQEIRGTINDFVAGLPDYNVLPNAFNDSKEFYGNPRAHQLYSFRLPWPNKNDSFGIYFRTQSEDGEAEDYLAAMQEAVILRTVADPRQLNDLALRTFPKEVRAFSGEVGRIAEQIKKERGLMVDVACLENATREKGMMRLNAYDILGRKGYSNKRILEIAGRIIDGEELVKEAIRDSFSL